MSRAGLPCVLRVTVGYACVRLRGPDHGHFYAGSYGEADLKWRACCVTEWAIAGRDVYV